MVIITFAKSHSLNVPAGVEVAPYFNGTLEGLNGVFFSYIFI